MLRLQGGQVESLWDELLPEKLRELPEALAQIDALVRDEALLAPIGARWEREAQARGRSAQAHGRPTIALQACTCGCWCSSTATAGARRRCCASSPTRCTCGGSASFRSTRRYRTNRRSGS